MKRFFSLMLVLMLALSITACGSKEKSSGSAAADAKTESNAAEGADSAALTVEEYLKEVESLNDAGTALMTAAQEANEIMLNPDATTEEMQAAIEAVRATKEGFLAVAAIDNPPADYETAHADLAASCNSVAAVLDEYADVILSGLDENVDEAAFDEAFNAVMVKYEAEFTALANNMAAVQAIGK